MIIAQYQINVEGNVSAQPIPSGWQIVVSELFISRDKTRIIICAFLNDSLSIHCDGFVDFTEEQLSPEYSNDAPVSFVRGVIEPLLNAKYGDGNWTRIV